MTSVVSKRLMLTAQGSARWHAVKAISSNREGVLHLQSWTLPRHLIGREEEHGQVTLGMGIT